MILLRLVSKNLKAFWWKEIRLIKNLLKYLLKFLIFSNLFIFNLFKKLKIIQKLHQFKVQKPGSVNLSVKSEVKRSLRTY